MKYLKHKKSWGRFWEPASISQVSFAETFTFWGGVVVVSQPGSHSWISTSVFSFYGTSRAQASHCPACFVIEDPFHSLACQDQSRRHQHEVSRRCNRHAGPYRLACSCTPSASLSLADFTVLSFCMIWLLLGNALRFMFNACKEPLLRNAFLKRQSNSWVSSLFNFLVCNPNYRFESLTGQLSSCLVPSGSAVPSPCLEVFKFPICSFRFQVSEIVSGLTVLGVPDSKFTAQ